MLVLHLMLVIRSFLTTCCRSRRLCTRWCIAKCSAFPWKYCLQNIKSCILIYSTIAIFKDDQRVSYKEMHIFIIKTVHTVPIIFWWHCRSLRVKAEMAFLGKDFNFITPQHIITVWLHNQWIMVLSHSRCNEI